MSEASELAELKRRFLRLLDEDVEFRYTVAGYLGLSELLKRLDGIEAEQLRLREEMAQMREEMVHMREEMKQMREEQIRLGKEQIRLGEEQMRLREEMAKVHEEMARMREEMIRMREEFDKRFETMRADFNRMLDMIDRRLTRVERTLEKLTLDIEEEARSIVAHRLREMGYEMVISPLMKPEVELDIYGATSELCVMGEASVRAGISVLRDLKRKLSIVEKRYPDLLRPKVLLIIYTSLAMPELVEEAEKEGIWVLKATEDIVAPRI